MFHPASNHPFLLFLPFPAFLYEHFSLSSACWHANPLLLSIYIRLDLPLPYTRLSSCPSCTKACPTSAQGVVKRSVAFQCKTMGG